MAIVGFNFSRISAEKKEAVKGKINISNNVSIKKIEEQTLHVGKGDQKALKFTYQFISKYDPGFGEITLDGDLLLILEEKKAKDVLDNWKKDKKIPKNIMTDVLNTVLSKCNVEALIMSKEIGLPPPIPLPKVNDGQTKQEFSQ